MIILFPENVRMNRKNNTQNSIIFRTFSKSVSASSKIDIAHKARSAISIFVFIIVIAFNYYFLIVPN